MDEMIIGIFSIVVFIVSIVIVLWIRAIYLNSENFYLKMESQSSCMVVVC
jgi:hypothetical protein